MNTCDLDCTQEAGRHEITRLDVLLKRQKHTWHGKEIVWRHIGDGPPLVLLHGGHGSWLHWIRNIEELAARHTVWLPDLPGNGESDTLLPLDEAEGGTEVLLRALEAGLDALLGPDRLIDLAGFSFGALLAAQLAARRGRVRRLALLGSAGHGMRRRNMTPMQNWRRQSGNQRWMAFRYNLGALMLHRAESIDALALAVYEQCCQQARFNSKAIARSALLLPALERCAQPTLFIWGEHDVTGIPEEIVDVVAGTRPGRQWCIVPNAGHWVQFEQACDVNRLLSAWFGIDASHHSDFGGTL